MRSFLSWDIPHRRVVILYRRFGKTYRYRITTLRCGISQKRADLVSKYKVLDTSIHSIMRSTSKPALIFQYSGIFLRQMVPTTIFLVRFKHLVS